MVRLGFVNYLKRQQNFKPIQHKVFSCHHVLIGHDVIALSVSLLGEESFLVQRTNKVHTYHSFCLNQAYNYKTFPQTQKLGSGNKVLGQLHQMEKKTQTHYAFIFEHVSSCYNNIIYEYPTFFNLFEKQF